MALRLQSFENARTTFSYVGGHTLSDEQEAEHSRAAQMLFAARAAQMLSDQQLALRLQSFESQGAQMLSDEQMALRAASRAAQIKSDEQLALSLAPYRHREQAERDHALAVALSALVVPGVQAVPGIQTESEPQIAADFKPDSMGGCSCVLCHVGCLPLTLVL